MILTSSINNYQEIFENNYILITFTSRLSSFAVQLYATKELKYYIYIHNDHRWLVCAKFYETIKGNNIYCSFSTQPHMYEKKK